jgi:RNA polymerase sigma factor (sigma-70 family)
MVLVQGGRFVPPMESPSVTHSSDLSLAQSVALGSLESWHTFVIRYSALILSIVRRYFPDSDEDARYEAYVRTLEHFYRSGLADYDGHTTLATWVMTVSRSRCLDVLRNRAGRKRFPGWVKSLSEIERFIYLRYFWHGESYGQLAERWGGRDPALTREVFIEALDHIESKLNRRSRLSMAYELEARSVRGVSKRLLEYMDHIRLDYETQRDAVRPDVQLLEQQARQTLERVTACLSELVTEEREILKLHYYHDLPASQIARTLGLPGSRKVYTMLHRALASLRRKMSLEGEPPLDDDLNLRPSSDPGGTRD